MLATATAQVRPKAFASATTTSGLHWWALDCSVRTEHAAITGLWLEPLATPLAVVKELARAGRHFFDGDVAEAEGT